MRGLLRRLPQRRSFRARLALTTVGIAGVVLVLFALLTWHTVQVVTLDRVDAEIAGDIRPQLARAGNPNHWTGFETALYALYAGRSWQSYILLIKDAQGRVVRQSNTWPDSISPSDFPPPRPNDPQLRPWAPPPGGPPHPPPPPDARGGPPPPPGPDGLPPHPLPITRATFTSRWGNGVHWRLGSISNGYARIVLGLSLTHLDAQMASMRNGLIAAVLGALALIAAASWFLSGRALRPLERLADTTEAITAVSLDRRLEAAGVETELLRLVTVFNEMLDRLERGFRQAVRFSADAAHELQTPLTILQGELEQALQSPRAAADQDVLGDLLEEVQRLKAIVRKLLLLSRVDSGAMQPALQPYDLSRAVEATREDAEALAPELTVTAVLAPEVWVMADADLLGQVLANLTSNAIKYNQPQGSVDIRLSADGPLITLCFTNTGPPITPEDREKVFDRFYRADPARSRGVDGLGLGLSLAREIARLHGGDLVLEHGGPEQTTFVLTLPLGRPPDT